LPEKKWERIFDINVALKVIRHISAGIYRTPGGALKELVSNAFDANATEVEIDSGYPRFTRLRIMDNGIGMDKRIVDRSFEYIGASIKVTEPETYEGRIPRPIIGQFGIGMLATAHVTTDVHIKTYPRDQDYGLEIVLNLKPYFEYESQIKTLEEFVFGTVRYREIPRGKEDRGTLVELVNISPGSNFHKAISKKARNYVPWPARGEREKKPGEAMQTFVRRMDEAGVSSIENLSGRERLLWELGVICPVEYLKDGPVAKEYLDPKTEKILDYIKERQEQLRFHVYFDGVQVRKPILLPTRKLRTTAIDQVDQGQLADIRTFPIEVERKLADGSSVKAVGYLFFQPYRIFPEELRGLYPRVRFVGVGRYDNTLFKAIRGEQPLLRVQLSGEIFILEGLDDALNLDRSGFIELDEGFQALRHSLVDIVAVGEEAVVRKVKKVSAQRTRRRRRIKLERKQDEFLHEVAQYVRRIAPSLTTIVRDPEEVAGHPGIVSYGLVAIDTSKKHVYVSPDVSEPVLVAVIVAADEVLSSHGNLREELAKTLRRVLSETP